MITTAFMPDNMKGLKILLIEDDDIVAKMLKERLSDGPLSICRIEWARTLSGGLQALTAMRFDIVLLDLGLTDSPSPMGTISNIPALKTQCPVDVVTGHEGYDIWKAAMDAGADDVLSKDGYVFAPNSAPYLAHAILSAIYRHGLRS